MGLAMLGVPSRDPELMGVFYPRPKDPDSDWHRGDRVLCRSTGQRGIVEGWKDGRLFVYWGTDRGRDCRSWVELADAEPATGVELKLP